MDQEEKIILWRAYRSLCVGKWPEDVLGEMPDFPDQNHVRWNAEEALEEILGKAWISRQWHMEELGRTEQEWLRWYTVGKFRYGKFRHKKRGGVPMALIVATAAIVSAILAFAARLLLGQ